jgi:hypothetical protein
MQINALGGAPRRLLCRKRKESIHFAAALKRRLTTAPGGLPEAMEAKS